MNFDVGAACILRSEGHEVGYWSLEIVSVLRDRLSGETVFFEARSFFQLSQGRLGGSGSSRSRKCFRNRIT
jgi:hypothetical protein